MGNSSQTLPDPTKNVVSFFQRPPLSEMVSDSQKFFRRSELFSEFLYEFLNLLVSSLSLSSQKTHKALTKQLSVWKMRARNEGINSPLTAFLDKISLLSPLSPLEDQQLMTTVFQSQVLPRIHPSLQNSPILLGQTVLLGSPIYKLRQEAFRSLALTLYGDSGVDVLAFYGPSYAPIHSGYVCLSEENPDIYHEVAHLVNEKIFSNKRNSWFKIFVDEATAYMAGDELNLTRTHEIIAGKDSEEIPQDLHDALYQLKYVWWLLSNLEIESHKICLYALECAENFEELFTMLAGIFIDKDLSAREDTFITRQEYLSDFHEEADPFLEDLFLARIYALQYLRSFQKRQDFQVPPEASLPLTYFFVWSLSDMLGLNTSDADNARFLNILGYYLYVFPDTTEKERIYIDTHLTAKEKLRIHQQRVKQVLS